MHRHQQKATQIIQEQINVTLPEETNATLVTDLKEKEIQEPGKEFKTIFLKRLTEMWENTDTQSSNQQNQSSSAWTKWEI